MDQSPESIQRIDQLMQAGKADDAHAVAHELLEEIESTPDNSVSGARTANLLGKHFSIANYDGQARRALNRALERLRASGQRDDDLLSTIYNNLGQLDQRGGDFVHAQEHLERALALLRGSSAHPVVVAYTADNLGSVLTQLGHFGRAERLQHEALAVLEAAGPKYRDDLATTLGNLGRLYHLCGDHVRARAYLLRSLDLHLQQAPLETGSARISLVNLVDLLLETGDEPVAVELTDLLLRVGGPKVGAVHHPTAIALFTLASAAFARFQLGMAERLATRSLALLEVTAGPSADETLQAIQLLANVHSAKGNYEAAEHGLMRVLKAKHHDPISSAAVMIDFGRAVRLRGVGSAPAAAAIFERAINTLRTPGAPVPSDHLPLLASALGNLAQVVSDLDDNTRAESLYDEALALGPPRSLGREHPWLIYCRALLLYHLSRHGEALRGLRQALRLWKRQSGAAHPFVATTLANLALVHWARGDLRAAQRCLDSAALVQAGEVQRRLLVGTEAQRLQAAHGTQGDLYKRITLCLHAGARGADARGAAQLLLQRKAAVLDAMALTHARLRDRLDDVARERLDRLAMLRRQMADRAIGAQAFGQQPDPREVMASQADEERLQTELSHAGAVGLGVLQPVTLQAVQAALPAGTVLLELVRWTVFDPVRTGHGSPWRGRRYAAMVLRPRGDPHWFDLGDADPLEASVGTLRGLLRDAESDPDDVKAAAASLYQCLIAPIEPLLKGCRVLHIAPDGELNLLPFAVLGGGGRPMLADRKIVLNYLSSGRDLLRGTQPAAAQTEVHAVVDADFDAGVTVAGPLHLQRLPGTRKEASALKRHFAQCTVHADINASAEVLRALSRPALLHIATHGLFLPPQGAPRPVPRTGWLFLGSEVLLWQSQSPAAIDNPMLGAGLALAGANASVPGRPTGFVSAAELAGLDLQGTELVVLSACDSGLGVAAHGDEFAGLRRAFAIAGADSQVISLWAVDDEAAAALMGEYYQRLANGVGRAEALRDAQVAVRRRPIFSHPNAWAAFVPWGHSGPLSAALRAAAAPAAL